MTKEQAIALAREKYLAHPELFFKLRPYRVKGDVWALGCWITPIFGWHIKVAEDFEPALKEILEASERWANEATNAQREPLLCA